MKINPSNFQLILSQNKDLKPLLQKHLRYELAEYDMLSRIPSLKPMLTNLIAKILPRLEEPDILAVLTQYFDEPIQIETIDSALVHNLNLPPEDLPNSEELADLLRNSIGLCIHRGGRTVRVTTWR